MPPVETDTTTDPGLDTLRRQQRVLLERLRLLRETQELGTSDPPTGLSEPQLSRHVLQDMTAALIRADIVLDLAIETLVDGNEEARRSNDVAIAALEHARSLRRAKDADASWWRTALTTSGTRVWSVLSNKSVITAIVSAITAAIGTLTSVVAGEMATGHSPFLAVIATLLGGGTP